MVRRLPEQWEYLYHYTSRPARARILLESRVVPNREGNIYLSPTRYLSPQEAQDELSVPTTKVDCGIRIKLSVLPESVRIVEVQNVPDLIDLVTGERFRTGGGLQVVIKGDNPKDGSLSLPVDIFNL